MSKTNGKPADESVKDLSGALPTKAKRKRYTKAERERRRDSRKETPAKPGMPGSVNDSRRCSATAHRTGERCKAPAMLGSSCCRVHGGAAPQTKKAAKERLLELADPAIATLRRIVLDENADDAVRLRASLGILDRVGLGPGSTIDLEVGLSKWDETSLIASGVDPATMQQGVIRNLPPDEPRALPRSGGGGNDPVGTEDYEQHATDEQARQWSDLDAEDARDAEAGRIRPDANTVTGVVVSRYDVPLDPVPTDPPRYWDEEAREADRGGR